MANQRNAGTRNKDLYTTQYGEVINLAQIRLAYQNRKIEGIQYIRERTGLGLAEAKALIEGTEDTLPQPEAYQTPDQTGKKRRRLPLVIFLVLAVAIPLCIQLLTR